MQSITDKILKNIRKYEANWCFSQKDFLDIAGRNAIEQAFYRLLKEGAIRRIGRGLYDVPHHSDLLKTTLSPDANQIAQAVARKFGWRIIPTGAHAANMLNISTQVPMKLIYQSDGPSREMSFGNRTIYFKKTSPKKLLASEMGGLLINALKYLGKDNVTSKTVSKLGHHFSEKQKQQLLNDARFGSDWVCETIQKICSQGDYDE